ncbi:hypothetical protein Btru_041563 [Bulinus truncatus]|nr:hypothetical protein Btru_041563 [Bulinus truncatus]
MASHCSDFTTRSLDKLGNECISKGYVPDCHLPEKTDNRIQPVTEKETLDTNSSHHLTCWKFESDTSNLAQECIRLYLEFHDLSLHNAKIRNRIRLQKKKAMCECNKILQAIIRYCEDQLECSWKCKCAVVPRPALEPPTTTPMPLTKQI